MALFVADKTLLRRVLFPLLTFTSIFTITIPYHFSMALRYHESDNDDEDVCGDFFFSCGIGDALGGVGGVGCTIP